MHIYSYITIIEWLGVYVFFHCYSLNLLNQLLILICIWPAWVCLAPHWGSPLLEVVVSFFVLIFLLLRWHCQRPSGWFELECPSPFGKIWNISPECVWWKGKSNEYTLRICTRGITARNWHGLSSWSLLCMCEKGGVTFHPEDIAYSALVLVGKKNQFGYFLYVPHVV